MIFGQLRVLLATACLASVLSAAGDPRITEAVLGQDKIDKANGYEIVNAATVFRPDSPQVVCVIKVEGASAGATLKAVWIAEDVGKVVPPNYKIAEKSLTMPFVNAGTFSLSKPDSGWPVGSYHVEIYLGGKLAKTVKFTVKAQ